MATHVDRGSEKAGLPPGTIVHVGSRKSDPVKITIIDYDEKDLCEKEAKTVEESFPFKDKPSVTWINVDGIHRVDVIEGLGTHFGVHHLLLEDIAHAEQRPKMEDFGTYIFIVLKMLYRRENEHRIVVEQVSLILGPNFVISFQEAGGDVFDPVRDRIRHAKGRIRRTGPDFLAYALIDAVVDNYFTIMENIGDEIERIEEELVANPTLSTLRAIHGLKRELIFLRKSIWPLREVIGGLERGGSSLVDEKTLFYLRDVYDHTIRVIETLETYRDILSGMIEMYLSSVSNRLNEVMKVLTIIATIFIPLTFVAGVYGMNFEYMPELKWRFGYFLIWGVMVSAAVFMLVVFRRRKWL